MAAVAVLIYHIPQQQIFVPYRLWLFDRAYLCVDLFFILSGFVISVGYYERTAVHPSATTYRDFLFNRMARVFPLHLVVTLLFAVRIAANVWDKATPPLSATDLVANILMIQSWGFDTIALAGNSWSVSTELMAYMLFPLIAIWAFARWLWPLLAIVAAVLLVFVAATGHGVEGVLDVVQRASTLPLLRCLAGFSIGVLTYRAAFHPQVRALLSGDGPFALSCAAIVLAFLVPRGDLLVVALFPLLVLCCYYEGRLARGVMGNPLSYHLGLISYSIYLWHPLFRDVGARIALIAQAHGFTHLDPAILLATLGVTWLWCWLSYRMIEVGGHRLVKLVEARFARRGSAPGAAE